MECTLRLTAVAGSLDRAQLLRLLEVALAKLGVDLSNSRLIIKVADVVARRRLAEEIELSVIEDFSLPEWDLPMNGSAGESGKRITVEPSEEESGRRLSNTYAVTFEVAEVIPGNGGLPQNLTRATPELNVALEQAFENEGLQWRVGTINLYDPDVTTTTYTTTTVPRVDCVWDDWLSWSKCTMPCGEGTRTRYRAIRLREKGGGTPCPGSAADTAVCNSNPCLECPKGYFLDIDLGSLTECTPCLAGRYNPDTGGIRSSACRACPAGMVSPEGSDSCTPCRPGSAVAQRISTQIPSTQAQNLTGFLTARRHIELPATASEGKAFFHVQCSSTDSNTLSIDLRAQGPNMPLFILLIDGREATRFSATEAFGAWSATSSSFVLQEGEHVAQLTATGDSLMLNSLQFRGQCAFVHPTELFCGKCNPGYYTDTEASTVCAPCEPGSYVGSYGASTCELCKNGTYSTLEGALDPSVCVNCPAGRAGTAPGLGSLLACDACRPGSFGSEDGVTTCRDCAPGSQSPMEASTSCDSCPMGRFSEVYGQANCTLCSPGSFSSTAGADNRSFCLPCPGGTRSEDAGMTSCEDCGVGTFSLMRALVCLNCPLGLYTDQLRSTTCKHCPLGMQAETQAASSCNNCGRGTYGIRNSSMNLISACELCPAGTFGTELGSTSLDACRDCGPGRFSSPGAVECQLCVAGTFSGWNAGACMPCATGRFAASGGASSCQACPKGEFRPDDHPADSCRQCERGRYNPSTAAGNASACLPCPGGTFGTGLGEGELESCLACPAGRFSVPGSTSCEICPAGTYSEEAAPACIDCAAGRFAPVSNSSSCLDCAAGKYRPASASGVSCLNCAAGKFSTQLAASAELTCKRCAKGTAGRADGATSCQTCPAGSHAAAEGLTLCNPCLAESFSPAGAHSCCPAQNVEDWPVSPAGSLSTPPGKSETRIHVEEACSEEFGLDSEHVAASMEMADTATLSVATLQGRITHDSKCLTCGSASCRLQIQAEKEIFRAGEAVTLQALVPVYHNRSWKYTPCQEEATLIVVGFGCASGTLSYFLTALTGVVVLTLLLGMLVEMILRSRLVHMLECNIDMFVSGRSMALPTVEMLRSSVIRCLKLPKGKLPPEQFSAWLTRDLSSGTGVGSSRVLHIEFSVQAKGKESEILRNRLLSGSWEAAEGARSIGCTRVEQQPPAIMKGRGQAPGLELFVLLEQAAAVCLGGVEAEGKGQRELHLAVAREVLKRLTSRAARSILLLQYICNIAAAAGLPYMGFSLMGKCEEGFPARVHTAWLVYVASSGLLSLLLLRFCLGGPRAREFCWRFHARLLIRMVFACIMLTDMYQDATFTVIAKKCGFGLWFVSAWLIALGMGVMQVLVQLVALLSCAWQYRKATTPERRESLMVEMAFLALRGSDNLTLVYAVRPAVEEQLGGASSWAMKMSEARIAFFRFIFEDVEQSALQVVFVIFYEDAALADKIWVSLSIATSLLLSFTLVVQCLPEVRDWLWYRVFARFPFAKRIQFTRMLWILISVGIYRLCSAFPWVSACSPSGDPCRSADFPWGCSDGKLTLAGLSARREVMYEVFLTSTWCTMGLMVAVSFCGFIWMRRHRAQRSLYQVNISHSYHAAARFGSTLQGLRPKTDIDSDLWLFSAHDVHRKALEKTGAAEADAFSGTTSSSSVATSAAKKIPKMVEAVDESLFFLAQGKGKAVAQLFGKQAEHLKKNLREIVDAVSQAKLGDEALASAQNFKQEALHAQQLARVRASVRALISKQHFLRADIVQKSNSISEATKGAAPLRLLPWTAIEAKGQLPKCGEEGGAVAVEDLLKQVSAKLGVSTTQAKSKLVIFFLSHRWLRAKGPRASHHPDSQDNVKATRLVAFAKWFIKLAQKTGLRCEVAFWVDWSCCEQDDPHKTALGISALPLYIAACTKILAWRTPDFERRCWTMVERVLSYAFCVGGLTPYAIDETFGAGDDERDFAAMEDQPADRLILDFGQPEMTSEMAGVCSSVASSWGSPDFGPRLSTSPRPPDSQGDVGCPFLGDVSPVDEPRADSGTSKRTSLATTLRSSRNSFNASLPRGSSFSFGSKKGGAGKAAVFKITRRSRKLPNPLDPQTCHLTRHSDRREISLLVDLALAVPAFEVFADRQPVEWGVTEIIEQSLGSRYDLPERWINGDAKPAEDWLTLTDVPKVADWHLVVKSATLLQGSSGREDADAVVWVDHGGESASGTPPTPEKIDALFQAADDSMSRKSGAATPEESLRDLILALKADLAKALESDDQAVLEAAVLRARTVELPEKQQAVEKACQLRLCAALESGDEAVMRGALRLVRSYGVEHLELVAVVRAEQKRLYDQGLTMRLQDLLKAPDVDFATLAAMHYTAQKHGLESIQKQVRSAAQVQVSILRGAGNLDGLAEARDLIAAEQWPDIMELVQKAMEELTMARALEVAAKKDDLPALRAIEVKAKEEGYEELRQIVQERLKEVAGRVGERMGLPADWDVVLRMAGTDTKRLLRKSEEEETSALVQKLQELVDFTFTGWGGFGKRTRTRDRGKEKVAECLKVMSVVRVQNAESYVNYKDRRKKVEAKVRVAKDCPTDEAWDVKTARIPLTGVNGAGGNPVDYKINEHYLWHGTDATAAEGITDSCFDLKRAGTKYGALFGPGIYLAESCMKADEYVHADSRGWFPLLLCRVALGRINLVDAKEPAKLGLKLEASCKNGGQYDSVIGDREKVVKTFREFIVFDSHQVYPEFIVWYTRVFS